MAIIEPTIDHIDDETVMRELRNLAGAVDKNDKALNDEMAQISQRQDNIEETVAGFEDSITQNTQDIATIKQNITTIEQDITAVENKNAEQDTAITQNETAIENEITARQNADEAEATARANADITEVQLQIVSGAIQLMLDRELGALNADVDAPFIKTMELIPTATERAFKIRVTFWDNTQYDTNDFVIPAGGGTDVSVTGVTIQDGTTPNSFQVQIELSDGTPISSNDYPFPEAVVNPYPTSVTLGLSGTTLTTTIGLSNSTNVTGSVDLAPILATYATQAWVTGQLASYATDSEVTAIQSDLQEQISGLKLSTDNNNMTLNGDSVQIVKTVSGSVSNGNLTINVNGVPSNQINIGGGILPDDGNIIAQPMYCSLDDFKSIFAGKTQVFELGSYGGILNDFCVKEGENIKFNKTLYAGFYYASSSGISCIGVIIVKKNTVLVANPGVATLSSLIHPGFTFTEVNGAHSCCLALETGGANSVIRMYQGENNMVDISNTPITDITSSTSSVTIKAYFYVSDD